MKKICKKLLIILTALTLLVSSFALGACNYSAKGLEGNYSEGEVASQGGWVVQKGDYVYFINGMTTAATDADGNTVAYENKYGEEVRGSLMRIKASDMAQGKYDGAETVVPLLLVASDYTSGIFVYGDYVYYATPTTAKNLDGETESNYVDFKRSRLDGKETMRDYYFRSDDASAEYRFVEVDGTVYCLHMDGKNLYSFNTKTKEDTLLAANTSSHLFHKTDLSDPYVYYTMNVTVDVDQQNSVQEDYTQVYRVRADATVELDKKNASYTVKDGTGAYTYTYDFDKDSLEELAKEHEGHDDQFKAGKIETYPYVNLGQLVLDGVGNNDERTQYNHAEDAAYTPDGYTYTLLGYENGGLYYRRKYVSGTSGTGESGWTFYLATENFTKDWNAVTGNAQTNKDDFGGAHEVVALTATNATSSSLFYIEENTHYYLYNNGTDIIRAQVGKNAAGVSDGSIANEVTVAKDAYAGSFLGLDNDSSNTYKYVYYTVSASVGIGVGRAVYDSNESGYAGNEADYYNRLIGGDEYKPVTVLGINHVSGWYNPEIIDGRIFFADATTLGTTALNNAQVVSIQSSGADKVMNNKEIKEYTELLNDAETALYEASTFSDKVGNALYYYYYTGDSELFQTVIDEQAEEDGYGEYSIFSEKEQKYFWAYVNKESFTDGKTSVNFATLLVNDDGEYFGLRSYFYNTIGVLSEEEEEDLVDVWRAIYLSDPVETEEEGLPTWAWVIIYVGIGVGVIGVACVVTLLILRNKKKKLAAAENAPKRKKYKVDMTYDETIDVYATEETPAEETAEESVEAPAEESVETEVSPEAETEEKTEE